jgi:hypothetical protein
MVCISFVRRRAECQQFINTIVRESVSQIAHLEGKFVCRRKLKSRSGSCYNEGRKTFFFFFSLVVSDIIVTLLEYSFIEVYTGQLKKKVTLSHVYIEVTSEPTITRHTVVRKTLKVCL